MLAEPNQHALRPAVTPGASVALDVCRFLLAFAVVVGHWTENIFTLGWKNRMDVAALAVSGFFVLSGFTIRMLSTRGKFDLPEFLIERGSRLWSVALPALLATCVLDRLAYDINPDFYLQNWDSQKGGPLLRLLSNALFSSELWGHDIPPFSNSPYWSLSYEAWFYLLFALYSARRWIWLVLATAVAGPNILFLMVPWLAGVLLFDVFNRAQDRRQLAITFVCSIIATLLLGAALVLRNGQLHDLFRLLQSGYFGFFHTDPAHSNYATFVPAMVFVPAYLAMLTGVKLFHILPPVSASVQRLARRVGDLTFPLYLFHFPLLMFCGATGFYNRRSSAQTLLLLFFVCAVIIPIAPLTTTFKKWLRRMMQRGWSRISSRSHSVAVQ